MEYDEPRYKSLKAIVKCKKYYQINGSYIYNCNPKLKKWILKGAKPPKCTGDIFFLIHTPFSAKLTQLGGKRDVVGKGGLQNGLKGEGTVQTRRAHPFNNPPLLSLRRVSPLGWQARPRGARRDKSFRGRRGNRTPLITSTRETCASEAVVLPPALSRSLKVVLNLSLKA